MFDGRSILEVIMFRRTFGVIVAGVAISCLGACSEMTPTVSTEGTAGFGGSNGGSGGDGGMTSSSGGSGGQAGASFCAGAPFLEFGAAANADLATGAQNLYTFKGQKGQVIAIDVDAQYLNGTSFDVTVIDSILTVYDNAGNQIAQNDDPIEYSTNDSRLYMILPKTDEYCIGVSDCWTTLTPLGITCGGEKDKLVTNYTLWLNRIFDNAGDNATVDEETGDTPADATEIPYVKDNMGRYLTTFWGNYDDETDVDVYGFTLPADVVVAPDGRPVGHFYFMPTGPDENGSTATMGAMWVTDATSPNQVLARVDANVNPRFRPRLELGKPYFLFVTRAKGMPLANDFYFVRHYALGSAPMELEKGSGQNDTPISAEVLGPNQQTSLVYVEGDIGANGADIDYFQADVPPGMTRVRAYCSAAIYGSGVRDLKVSVFGANGVTLQGAFENIEGSDKPAQVIDAPIGSQTKLLFRVEAGGQDPEIVSTFYDCTIRFGS